MRGATLPGAAGPWTAGRADAATPDHSQLRRSLGQAPAPSPRSRWTGTLDIALDLGLGNRDLTPAFGRPAAARLRPTTPSTAPTTGIRSKEDGARQERRIESTRCRSVVVADAGMSLTLGSPTEA